MSWNLPLLSLRAVVAKKNRHRAFHNHFKRLSPSSLRMSLIAVNKWCLSSSDRILAACQTKTIGTLHASNKLKHFTIYLLARKSDTAPVRRYRRAVYASATSTTSSANLTSQTYASRLASVAADGDIYNVLNAWPSLSTLPSDVMIQGWIFSFYKCQCDFKWILRCIHDASGLS